MKTLKLRVLLLGLVCWSSLLSNVTAQDPRARASLESKGEVWVGQSVTLVVELLAPGFFASAVTFDVPDPPGMLIVPPSEKPVVGTETIDGVSYTVQRYELSIMSRRAGEIDVPPITARFQFKREPLAKETVPAAVTTTPLKFTAKVPPAAEKLGRLLSARNLSATESWKPDTRVAKAGDAFTRVITFTAEDIPAIALPAIPASAVEGLGIYPKPPELIEHHERGEHRSERRETVTYVCQRPGEFEIPEVRFSWFDLENQQLRVVVFPARTLKAVANPALGDNPAAVVPSREQGKSVVLTSAVIAALALIVFLVRRQIRDHWTKLIAPLRPVHLQPLNPPPSFTGHS